MDPGAHIDLHLPRGLVRQYSLCGDPADRGRWQVAVFREPEGRGGSACVHDDLAPGDELAAAGPRNNFPLVDAGDYLFIAGGIGITPILPMLAEASRRGRPWRLAYGGRTRASMAFLPELAAHGGRVTSGRRTSAACCRWTPCSPRRIRARAPSTAAAPSRCCARSRTAVPPAPCTWSAFDLPSPSPPRTSRSRWSWPAVAA
jgi:ferredoxin-NADP reductase